jgi:dTDP-4-dehydrorhamnose reductase
VKLWITGANGFLAKAFQEVCFNQEITFVATSKDEVDISSSDQINRFIEKHSAKPFTHIINCAAFAHVDLAEKNPQAAFRVNALGPENLGKAARQLKSGICHFSTEYIFNGCPAGSYTECDSPKPVGVYAITKREGELRLLAENPNGCIFRTSWLFGRAGKTFLSSLFDRIREEKAIQVVADQKGRFTYVQDLIAAVFRFFDYKGILHFANQGEASRYEIALFMRQCTIEANIPIACQEITPVLSNSFTQMNQRPSRCILDTSNIEKIQKHSIRTWKEAVKDFVLLSRVPCCL